mmetsp:Transcript_9380/g.24867  ORF Transcript_9380/g.24867 Transcript_9380/m.24867 type:complete len:127 (+) Transcript_9380:5796-6176(+)
MLLGGASGVIAGDGFTVAAVPLLLLGTFLLIQTSVVRFVFTDSTFTVAKKTSNPEELEFVNSWAYSSITNWEVWWEPFPVLCYFKETESYDGRGSIHFFPVLFNGRALVNAFQTKTVRKPNYRAPQ